jgi:hypothetical protein
MSYINNTLTSYQQFDDFTYSSCISVLRMFKVSSFKIMHAKTTFKKLTCFAVVTSITVFTGARVWIHSIHTCAMEGTRDSDTIVDIYKVIGKWKGMIYYNCIFRWHHRNIVLYMHMSNDYEQSAAWLTFLTLGHIADHLFQ